MNREQKIAKVMILLLQNPMLGMNHTVQGIAHKVFQDGILDHDDEVTGFEECYAISCIADARLRGDKTCFAYYSELHDVDKDDNIELVMKHIAQPAPSVAVKALQELHAAEHAKLGEMLLDKSEDGQSKANWQGGRVNGIGAAISALSAQVQDVVGWQPIETAV